LRKDKCLVVISGQTREYKMAWPSIANFIASMQSNHALISNRELEVGILFITWDKSYSIFPFGVESFIESVTEQDIHKTLSVDLPTNIDYKVKIVPLDEAKRFVSRHVEYCGDVDFPLVAYLNHISLIEMMESEERIGGAYDYVVKIRPDLYISETPFMGYLNKISSHAAYSRGPYVPFHMDGSVMQTQYQDLFEVFGRTAFIAYCQMMLTIKEKTLKIPHFLHTWVFGHLHLFGIGIQPLPSIQDHCLIIRPLHKIVETFKLKKAIGMDHKLISRMDAYWSSYMPVKFRDKWIGIFEHN